MSKMKCFGLFAGCALATGALYAAAAVSETFESTAEEGKPANWSNGAVTTSNFNYSATAAAFPISASLPTPNKVLVIEGSTVYSGATPSGDALVDMMVQTARPDDELGFPSAENTNDIQIAVAVDSDGCFNAYCQNKSGVVGWYKLSDTVYDQAGWARVSFIFNYAANRCQIRIDGQPISSDYGYVQATSAAGDTAKGAWYTLAKNTASSGVTSMKVIGCTAIDEVLMDVSSATYPIAATSDASGVPYAWYDSYGLAWNASGEYDASGMTAAEKFNACLSPFDGQTFEIKSVGVKDVSGTKKVTVAVPVPDGTRSDRQIVVDYSTDKTFETKQSVVVGNTGTVEIDAPVSGAVFYRLRATDAQ